MKDNNNTTELSEKTPQEIIQEKDIDYFLNLIKGKDGHADGLARV